VWVDRERAQRAAEGSRQHGLSAYDAAHAAGSSTGAALAVAPRFTPGCVSVAEARRASYFGPQS
jgi:hypothetical protein